MIGLTILQPQATAPSDQHKTEKTASRLKFLILYENERLAGDDKELVFSFHTEFTLHYSREDHDVS